MKEVIITSIIVALLGFGAAVSIMQFTETEPYNGERVERQSLAEDITRMGFDASELEYMGIDKEGKGFYYIKEVIK